MISVENVTHFDGQGVCEKYIEEMWSCPLNAYIPVQNFFFYPPSSEENKTHLHLDGHFSFWPTYGELKDDFRYHRQLKIFSNRQNQGSSWQWQWWQHRSTSLRASAEAKRTVSGSRGRMHLTVTSWFFLLFPYGHLMAWITAMYMNILQPSWPNQDIGKHHLPSFNSEFQSFV